MLPVIYVAPGFIDMHIHGGGGHDFMDGTVEAFLGIAETHAKYGTTSMVPTTLTCSDTELMNMFATYRKAKVLNTKRSKVHRFTFRRTLLLPQTKRSTRSYILEEATTGRIKRYSRIFGRYYTLECRS